VEKANEKFESYYNALGLVPEEENEEFWTTMRRELPNSFRFTGSKGYSQQILHVVIPDFNLLSRHALTVQQRLIDHYIPQISAVTYEGQIVEPPKPVEWFPERLAWSMTTPKQVVRRFPPFKHFQQFLVSETTTGNISRQEVVSMIPPLVMDVRPGMMVLDLCAAPGSKSAQLIELIHGGEEARVRKILHRVEQEEGRAGSPDGVAVDLEKSEAESDGDWSDDGRSTGLLIANDVDYRRAQMLIHQVKRLNSPNLIVTNHDAQQFPSIKLPSAAGANRYLKFDRVLADVPCSGDGTARKNPNIWNDWSPGSAIGLHPMQVRILVRALQMLKVGGRTVYSTCSMNPVENEAVVAAAIDICGGNSKVRVIDCSDKLSDLKRVPGLKSWKVMGKSGQIWHTVQELENEMKNTENLQQRNSLSQVPSTIFPPPDTSEEERIPLERCMRIYPHFQDTGGFFIVVLEKLSEIRAREESNRAKARARTAAAATAADGEQEINPATEPENGHLEDRNPNAQNGSKKRTRDDEAASSPPVKKVKNGLEDGQTQLIPDASENPNPKGIDVDVESEKNEAETKANPIKFELDSTADMIAARPKSNQIREEPYKYLDSSHPDLERIYEFYQLNARFPRDRFMVRNGTGEPVKAIYYTSLLVRDILIANEGKGLKFVQAGVKMFMKQDAQGQDICRWRIQTEGLPILEAWVGEARVVRLYKRPTLRRLLLEMFIKVNGSSWQELNEIGERFRDMTMGCAVLRVEITDEDDGFT
jgi:multisite-specific tRNA:(cytosine-C5)-methyltransferase